MAKATRKSKAAVVQYCRECSLATWVTGEHRHLDVHGKPFCLTCAHVDYYITKSTNAKDCPYYIHGTPKKCKSNA
jgi:hypothetical protein|nr:MAG TPA: hypothetical protein [Caudoviricetes sp.]